MRHPPQPGPLPQLTFSHRLARLAATRVSWGSPVPTAQAQHCLWSSDLADPSSAGGLLSVWASLTTLPLWLQPVLPRQPLPVSPAACRLACSSWSRISRVRCLFSTAGRESGSGRAWAGPLQPGLCRGGLRRRRRPGKEVSPISTCLLLLLGLTWLLNRKSWRVTWPSSGWQKCRLQSGALRVEGWHAEWDAGPDEGEIGSAGVRIGRARCLEACLGVTAGVMAEAKRC